MIHPDKITNVTEAAPALTPNGDGRLTRDDLVGRVIAYSVNRFDADAPSKYGRTAAEIDVDVVVVTGPRAGARDPDCRLRSTLARQLAERCPHGMTAVARVVTGTTDRGTWFGIDAATPDEIEQARRVVASHFSGVPTPPAAEHAAHGPRGDDAPPF